MRFASTADPHWSFQAAYPLINTSKADGKMAKVEHITLQNILSLDQTACCLEIEPLE